MRCVGCDVFFFFSFLIAGCLRAEKKRVFQQRGLLFCFFLSLSFLWFVVYSLWRGEDTLLATAVVDLVFVAFCGCFSYISDGGVRSCFFNNNDGRTFLKEKKTIWDGCISKVCGRGISYMILYYMTR